jgi:hypothetical protein
MDGIRSAWRRDKCARVVSVELWEGDTLLLDTAASEDPEAALDHLLRLARDYYRAPAWDDTLPPDFALASAYADHIS